MTIYIDLILIENIIMNYILLVSTSVICEEKKYYLRIFISSLLGAIYTILLYFTKIKIFSSIIIRIFLSIIMVYISFNSKRIQSFFKQLIIFYLTSFCFGGIVFYFLNNKFNKINNLLLSIVLGAIVGFIMIVVAFKKNRKKIEKEEILYEMEIFYKERKSRFKVMLDTGNLLKDPITNMPVAIIEMEKIEEIIGKEGKNTILEFMNFNTEKNTNFEVKTRCSVIPYKSIGNTRGLIIGFRPDHIIIYKDKKRMLKTKCILGIYEKNIFDKKYYSGLIGLNILNLGT